MDAKDLRTEAALGDRNNDGNSKYAQGGAALPCNRNKPYHDVGSNSLAKVDVQTARPCAVIGPDRVVPPPASNDSYVRKGPTDPWLGMDTSYRRPPDYPQKLVDYQHPIRNISPRQTFQENMQRIMVPPSYNSAKLKDDHNFPVDTSIPAMRSNKLNMPTEAKYCDVPYTINPMVNEHKNVRNDIGVNNVNSTVPRNGPHAWPSGAGNVRPQKPYGAPELYQYPDYSNCSGPRPMVMARSHRTAHDESGPVYSEAYYPDGSIRFKPYPSVKERYPQSRYEYITNYTNPFHPPPPFPSHKYDLQKQMPPHPYPGYPQVPLKYLEARMSDQIMNGYPRTVNPQPNFNSIPFRNQVIHPTYGAVPGSCVQPNKFYPYPPDNSVKSMASNKLPYDTNNKLYADYENSRTKAYSMPEGFYLNEITRPHPMKGPVLTSNYPPTNVHPHPYYRKDNPAMKNYEFGPHFRNIDSTVNINGNPSSRFPSQFSPNTIAISPSDSNTSIDTNQTQGTLQEDCGYISQSSSASIRSIDSGIHRIPHDNMYRRYDYGYAPLARTSNLMSKHEINPNNNGPKDKKNIDVRQFLQMWNDGEDENIETNSKEVNVKTITNNTNEISNSHDGKTKEQLYILGSVNVPREELGKYEHIQKVSKLPENIKGYNNIEILNKFEEVIEASYFNNYNMKQKAPRELHLPYKGPMTMQELGIPPRPLSPLDVEAKISQSVIHKEVGCNFEIKPCSPKMLNVEVATPVQSIVAERIIEKVTNPLIISSPGLHAVEERTESCNVMKSKDRLMSVNDKSKIPSCKMINTQCSSNEPVDSVKTSYSLQDFESSSGVCLASLPQLDNDIELNFPEVNQQFINANKVESVITTTQLQDLPDLDVEQPGIKDSKETESNQSLAKNEKELSKLTKYRKLKKNGSQCKSSISEPIAQAMRKDSVIIKNPENTKGQEENIETNFNNRPTNNFVEAQHKPMNLTVYSENRINSIDSNLDKPNEFAIDFSLNSNENYDFANNSETKINSEKHHTFTDNTYMYEERQTEDCKELHPSQTQNEILKPCEKTKSEITEPNIKSQDQFSDPSVKPESPNGNDIQDESRNLLLMPLEETKSIITRNSDLVIEYTTKSSHIEDSSKHTVDDESNRNIKSHFDQSLDSPFNDKLKTSDDKDSTNERLDSNNLDNFTENENIEYNSNETLTANTECLQENVVSARAFIQQKVIDDAIESTEQISCLPTPAQLNLTELPKQIDPLPRENAQIHGTLLRANREYSNKKFLSDSIVLNSSRLRFNQSKKASENECGSDMRNENIMCGKKELFSPRIQNLIMYHEGFCITASFLSKQKCELLSDESMITYDAFVAQHELVKSNNCEKEEKRNIVADTNINHEKSCDERIATTSNKEMEPILIKNTDNTCEDQISNKIIKDHVITAKDQNNLDFKSADTDSEDIIDNLQYNSVDVRMQISETLKTEHNSGPDLNESINISKTDINNDRLVAEKSITEELDEDMTDSYIIEDTVQSLKQKDLKILEPTIVNNIIKGNKAKTSNCVLKENKAQPYELISGKNETKDADSSIVPFNPGTFSADSIQESHTQIKENSHTADQQSKSESTMEYDDKTCLNKNEKLINWDADASKPIVYVNTTQYDCSNINDLSKESTSEASDLPIVLCSSQVKNCKLSIREMSDICMNSPEDEQLKIPLNHSNRAINISSEAVDIKKNDMIIKSSQEFSESTEKDTDNVKLKNPQLYETFPNITINRAPKRRCLKRSVSESALDDMRDISKQEVSEYNFLRPNKRKKTLEPENIPELIAQDYCNIIQNNRRNSISAIQNDDNGLYCILIDDNCIIAENCDDTEKICFTEIPEDCLSCIPPDPPNADMENTTEGIAFQEEINCDYTDYSNPFTSDNQEEEHSFEEPWVEDVACMETVFSDDVAEDIVISAASSPKDPDSPNDECENETVILYDGNNHTDKVKYIYGEKMCSNDAQLVETLYRTPQMNVNKTLINKESQVTEECNRYYDKESLEKVLSESNISEETIGGKDDINSKSSLFHPDFVKNEKENIDVDGLGTGSYTSIEFKEKDFNITSNAITKTKELVNTYDSKETQDDTIHSCESSIDNVFAYSKREDSSNCTISSSPEVSSTTSEERNSGIFLKITNYGGSRVSQINDINSVNNTNRISCKYTENIDYLNTNNSLPSRPLLTKAAQKYIPPLKETIPDLKVKLPLPTHSLIKLKQLKVSKETPKFNNKPNVVAKRKEIPKKPKPKFEDVLKSIDEIQFQMHKEKNKKIKKSIPKVVIKKSHNGSHYASTAGNDKYNPDLTGRKWQPWVFLEKNNFIDKMALKRKNRAVFNHRKNNYVLIEKFKKYKSIQNPKFVITQPNLDDSTSGQLKYTIRLKHTY